MNTPPRSKDEIILAFLRLRQEGWTVREIATRFNYSPSYVDQATHKVRTADIAESGEGVLAVDRCYWRAGPRRAAA